MDMSAVINGHSIKRNGHGGTTVKVDGVTCRATDLMRMFEPRMPPKIFGEYYAMSHVQRKSFLFNEATKLIKKESPTANCLVDGMGGKLNLDDYLPVILMDQKKERVIYDKVERKISDHTWDAILEIIPSADGKADFRSRTVFGRVVFDPKRIEHMWQMGELTYFNLYKAPFWRTVDLEAKLPEDFKTFIEFLIPEEDARKFSLRWIREMIEGQNFTFLILNGRKGIGKSALIDMLSVLIGKDYVGKPPRNWLDTHFNAWLENKRFVYSEECTLSEERHEQMKDLIEGDQSITKKGKDSLKSAPIHASYILTNNKIKNCYAEWDDRRFSYIELAEVDYPGGSEALGKLIDGIQTKMKDVEYLTELGKWLLTQEYPEWDCRIPYKGPKFDLIVKNSLPTWQRSLVECALEGKPKYALREIKNKWENPLEMKWPKEITVSDFVNGFRPHGRKLGHYEDKTFYPNQGDENGRKDEQGQGIEL